jgi:hypothetical protein
MAGTDRDAIKGREQYGNLAGLAPLDPLQPVDQLGPAQLHRK